MTLHSPQPIFRVEHIRRIEARYIVGAQPPLMERAGRAAAARALSMLAGRTGPVLVAAGPGNNGGDGFVVARHLQEAGYDTVVAAIGDVSRLPPDAADAHRAWIAAGGTVADDFADTPWALVVDALLGIGAARPLEGRLAQWVARINALGCPVLALDVPTGLDADTGRIMGGAIKATGTATFIGLKPGLLTLDGPDHCGAISVHDLALDLSGDTGAGESIGPLSFVQRLQPRPHNSHKGTYGEAGIIGGAPGMVGACLLAGRAALKLGAGRVYVGLLDVDAPAVDPLQPELMLRTADEVHSLASALAIGCGLGRSEAALVQLRRALDFAGPLLIDADGLSLLGAHASLATAAAARKGDTVLTPHPAEAARLLQSEIAQVQADRVAAALELARRYRAHVVLKGCGSVLADPDGRWRINTSGNAGLASAGTGDTLSGLTLALLAQGWPARDALAGAVHLHGAAAEWLAARGVGPVGLVAGELADAARAVFNGWIKDA